MIDRLVGAFQIGKKSGAGRRSRGRFDPKAGRRSRGRFDPKARWRDRARQPVQQFRPHETGVARPALRVQDLQLRAPAGWPVPVAADAGGAPLAHDVPAQPDPARPAELQPQPARRLDRRCQPVAQRRRLQHEQQRPGPASQRRQPAQPVPDAGTGDCRIAALRQVQHQDVHGPRGQERARHLERVVQRRRRQDHQPLRRDAAGHGLHRIKRAGEVQPGDDRPAGLSRRRDPQRQRGLARRHVPAKRHRGRARQAAGAEDGVQRREPRGDDAALEVLGRDAGAWPGGRGEPGARGSSRWHDRVIGRHRRESQRALDLRHR